MSASGLLTRLNLGCGRDVREGWVNVDCAPLPGVDHVVDFDDKPVLPFGDDSVAYSEGVHVIEHLRRPLPFMEELWRGEDMTFCLRCAAAGIPVYVHTGVEVGHVKSVILGNVS